MPLPLVSAGLSSLLVTMVALGMLMAFAKQEPGARQALAAAGPGVPLRILSWLGLAAPAPLNRGGSRAGGGEEGGGSPMSVVLAGGGTAGHIEPALALADALRRADPQLPITCLGTERGLETRLVPLRGYDLALIPAVPLPRSLTPQLLSVPGRLGAAVAAAAAILDESGAQVLVGFGGYVATPGYLAAKRRRDPDRGARGELPARAWPTASGRCSPRMCSPGSPAPGSPHATCIGIPIRREISGLDRLAAGDKARAHFGLHHDLPVLLVTGGSQGARSINRAVTAAAGWIRQAGIQVLHIVGPRSDVEVPPPGGPAPYMTLPYLDRMDLAYAAADFALCRAGAMTCAELTAVGLPAVYVPLPHGNGEQRLNAAPIEDAGGGLIVDDAGLTPGLGPRHADPGAARSGTGRRDVARRRAGRATAMPMTHWPRGARRHAGRSAARPRPAARRFPARGEPPAHGGIPARDASPARTGRRLRTGRQPGSGHRPGTGRQPGGPRGHGGSRRGGHRSR